MDIALRTWKDINRDLKFQTFTRTFITLLTQPTPSNLVTMIKNSAMFTNVPFIDHATNDVRRTK